MVQPLVYNTEQELIDWLNYDLEDQRVKLISKGVKRENIKYENLILNIGSKDNLLLRREVIFLFDFKSIINNVFSLDFNRVKGEDILICPLIVNCRNILFRMKADFLKLIFNTSVDFMASIFNNSASFISSTFKGNTNFQFTTFNIGVNFMYSVFEELSDFSSSIHSGKTIFSDIKFSYKLEFNNIVFEKGQGYILFAYINYDEVNEKFKECGENSKIQITNTVIDGRIDFNNVKVNKINFKGSSVIGGGVVSRVNFEAEPENSDTARFLKHEELARSNTIKALEYKAKEKDLYEDELKDNKSNKKFLEIFAERLSLILSRLSNDHGQNWIQAVLFTFITGFIFFFTAYASIYVKNVTIYLVVGIIQVAYPFVLLLIFKKKRAIVMNYPFMFFAIIAMSLLIVMNSSFMKGFFNYLIPINFDLMKEVGKEIKMTPINTFDFDMALLNRLRLFSFYFFYILGKIAIGYGIFQTIQAFRKFNIK